MTLIRTIEGIRIAEHGRGPFERDAMLGAVDRRLPSVPLEHDSVYTKRGRLVVPIPVGRLQSGWKEAMEGVRFALNFSSQQREPTVLKRDCPVANSTRARTISPKSRVNHLSSHSSWKTSKSFRESRQRDVISAPPRRHQQ